MTEPVPSKACVVCRTGMRKPGTTSETLTRGDTTITVHHVPAEVCDNCGEAYFDSATVDALQQMLNTLIAVGTRLAVMDYTAKVA